MRLSWPCLLILLLGWGGCSESSSSGPEAASAKDVALLVPEDVQPWAEEAAELYGQGDLEGAADLYEEIILRHRDNLYAWSNLGIVRFQEKKYGQAAEALERAVVLNPDDGFSHSVLGMVYYHMGRRPDAISALQHGVELGAQDPKTLNCLGLALSQEGRKEAAEAYLLRSVEAAPHYGDAHFNLGVNYLLKDSADPAAAHRHYQRALALGVPSCPTFEELLGDLLVPESSNAKEQKN